MRSARQQWTLALAPLILLGTTEAKAGARTVVRRTAIPHQRVVVVGPAFVDPFFWDPFWHPGWGVYYAYGPSPYDRHARPAPRHAAPVELHVSPRKAKVSVDGDEVGQARDFDSRAYPLWLKPGTHELELSRPGYQTLRVKIDVKKGRAYRVRYDLREGEGLDPRSIVKSTGTAAEPGS